MNSPEKEKREQETYESFFAGSDQQKSPLRPQPKQEWNEEDEKIYNKALDAIYYKDLNDKYEVVDALEALSGLISRKRKVIPPYARWKPSERMLNALKWAKSEFHPDCPETMEQLNYLYTELKKIYYDGI